MGTVAGVGVVSPMVQCAGSGTARRKLTGRRRGHADQRDMWPSGRSVCGGSLSLLPFSLGSSDTESGMGVDIKCPDTWPVEGPVGSLTCHPLNSVRDALRPCREGRVEAVPLLTPAAESWTGARPCTLSSPARSSVRKGGGPTWHLSSRRGGTAAVSWFGGSLSGRPPLSPPWERWRVLGLEFFLDTHTGIHSFGPSSNFMSHLLGSPLLLKLVVEWLLLSATEP